MNVNNPLVDLIVDRLQEEEEGELILTYDVNSLEINTDITKEIL